MYSHIYFIVEDIRNSNKILDLLYFIVNVNHVDYCYKLFWFLSCLYLGDEEHTRETIINFFTDNRIDWFLVFGLLCRHTASNPITAEMHTSSVR